MRADRLTVGQELARMGRDTVSLRRGGLGVDLLRFRQFLGVS